MIWYLFRWIFSSYRKPRKFAKGKDVDKHAELVGLKRRWFETDCALKARILLAMYGGKEPPKKSWAERFMANRRAMRSWP